MIHGMNRLMGTIFIVEHVLFVIGLTVYQPNTVYGGFPYTSLSSFSIVISFSSSAVKKGISKSSRTASSDTSKVVDAVIDALISQRPQTRYPVGLDAKVSIVISFLPTFIADYLFQKNMNAKK